MLKSEWDIELINSKFHQMISTLQQRGNVPSQVENLMKNKIHIEELTEKISQRLCSLGINMTSFNGLERQISNYYEERED